MTDPNVAFTMKVRLFTNEPTIVIVVSDDMRPQWDSAGRVRLTCEVRQGGKVIFPKGQLYGAHHGSSDGIKAHAHMLFLVATAPGDTDTDADYFEGYSEAQLDWARHNGEALSCERMHRYCDDNGNVRKARRV